MRRAVVARDGPRADIAACSLLTMCGSIPRASVCSNQHHGGLRWRHHFLRLLIVVAQHSTTSSCEHATSHAPGSTTRRDAVRQHAVVARVDLKQVVASRQGTATLDRLYRATTTLRARAATRRSGRTARGHVPSAHIAHWPLRGGTAAETSSARGRRQQSVPSCNWRYRCRFSFGSCCQSSCSPSA